MIRVLGIVPARAGSKRLVDKNLRLLSGKPLVLRVLEAALSAGSLAKVVVSSDDERVLTLVRDIDPQLALERPAALATDTAPAIDYVKHALAAVEAPHTERFDAVALLQPSSPLTKAEDIDETVNLLIDSGSDSAVSVTEIDHAIHPLKLKVLDGKARLHPYWEDEAGRMASHELPRLWVRNCSVYVSRREVIDRGRVLGDDCRGYVMPRSRSIDINDEFDLRLAELLLGETQ